MEGKLAEYRNFEISVKYLLLASGIWPRSGSASYRVVTFVTASTLGICGAKIFYFCLENLARMSVFAQGMSHAFSFYTSVCKVLSFVLYREELMTLEDELGYKFERELKMVQNRPFLLHRISIYRRFMYVISVLVTVALLLNAVVPLLYIIKYKKYTYIYVGRYPFNVPPGSFVYWSVIGIEVLSVVSTWTVVNGVDNAFGLHCFRICGLLRLLGRRYRELTPSNPRYKEELRESVLTHQLLIKSKIALQRVFGLVVLWTYVTSAIIMCSIMYQADKAKKHMTVARIIFLSSYIMLKLLQAFTYAYYGSLVTRESEKCQEAVYMSDWPGSGDLRLMKDMLIIRSQRVLVLKAKAFFIITMEMFEKIVNTTISYFLLLQTVDGKKQ